MITLERVNLFAAKRADNDTFDLEAISDNESLRCTTYVGPADDAADIDTDDGAGDETGTETGVIVAEPGNLMI